MNVVVIGLGSMGKRRVRLLKRLAETEELTVVGIDSNVSRRKETEELLHIATYESLDAAMADSRLDAAVISTSPLSHANIISDCLKRKLHVFTEINLVADGYDDNIKLAKDCGKVLFLSSTPMYRKEIQYIKDVASNGFKGMYHYHIGQYLPEWHPWENYKDFFVGDKRSNGCRELFAIELPWMVDAFGEVVNYSMLHKRVSNLELPYDDCYTVILEHKSGIIGNLTIDVVTPKGGREFELWGEGKYLEWKGTPDSLAEYEASEKRMNPIYLYDSYEHNENYNKFVIEDAYFDELINFVGVIKSTQKALYSFEKDAKVLSLIDGIEGIV